MPRSYDKQIPNISEGSDSRDVLVPNEKVYEDWTKKRNEYDRFSFFLQAIRDKEESALFRTEGFKNILSVVENMLINAGFITLVDGKICIDSGGTSLINQDVVRDADWELYCKRLILEKIVSHSNIQSGHDFCTVKRNESFDGEEDNESHSYGILLYLLGIVESIEKFEIQRSKIKKFEFDLTDCGKRVYKRLCDQTNLTGSEELDVPTSKTNKFRYPIMGAVVLLIVIVIVFLYLYKTQGIYDKESIDLNFFEKFQLYIEREKFPTPTLEDSKSISK